MTTSCQLVLEGKISIKTIDFERGCVMQENNPAQYQVLLNYLNYKKRKRDSSMIESLIIIYFIILKGG